MAYYSYEKIWRSECYNNVLAKNKDQYINLNKLKLKLNDTYRKNENSATNFELSNDEDVINEAFLDRN